MVRLMRESLVISDVRETMLVMKDGVLYKPEELHSALGVPS